MASFLEDLQQAVRDAGVPLAAQAAGISEKLVRRFLKDPMSIRISTLSHLATGMNMPTGVFHLIDREGRCLTCNGPRDVHYPLFPREEAS